MSAPDPATAPAPAAAPAGSRQRAEQLCAGLTRAWIDHLVAKRRPKRRAQGTERWQPVNVWASSRRQCVRAMALDMLHPEDREVSDPDAMERMERGNEVEDLAVARLKQVGPRMTPPFRVVEEQVRFEVKDRDGTVLVSGKMDARLRFETGESPICEWKSGQTFQRAETLEDLDRGYWTRHAIDQLLVYLLANGEPWGLFGISKPGVPLFLPVYLEDHLDRAEVFLVDARRAVDARHGKKPLPDFIRDTWECRLCDHFGKSCSPPEFYGPGWKTIVDPDLIELAKLREQAEPKHREYEHADKVLKDKLRGVEHAILGPYEVEGRWQTRTKYEVPEAVKMEYAKADPHGAFNLKLRRVVMEQPSMSTPAKEGNDGAVDPVKTRG